MARDKMRKKRPVFIISIVILAALFSALYLIENEDVEVLNISTDCKKVPCEINFHLENKTNYYVTCKVSIIGLWRSTGRNTATAAKTGFSGEKTVDYKLHPKETKKVKETLNLKGGTMRITVKVYDVKIQKQ